MHTVRLACAVPVLCVKPTMYEDLRLVARVKDTLRVVAMWRGRLRTRSTNERENAVFTSAKKNRHPMPRFSKQRRYDPQAAGYYAPLRTYWGKQPNAEHREVRLTRGQQEPGCGAPGRYEEHK